ncbi:MAG: choice-of-anchor B family protein [Bacteroidota bacterium]
MNIGREAICIVFFLIASFSLWGQKNIELVGRLEYPFTSRLSSDEILNDIWGYVSPDGREYALVGTFNGLSIVDLEDPSNPREIHFVSGPESFWRDVKTYESYAYVCNETADGLTIVDLSGLPGRIESKEFLPAGRSTAHNLYQTDGRLYVVGFNQVRGGIIILDLESDPWNPTEIGLYDDAYVHDVYVRDNIAYAAEINDARLRILDLSDLTDIQVLGERTYAGAFTHNTWLNDAGDVCFTTDELGRAFIRSWDVSDPGNIEELDKIRASRSGGTAIPHNVHVLNDFLVSSYYGDGIQIVDASRPESLVEIGYFDTAPNKETGFVGCWGAYPFLPSGLVLATDLSNGLFVLRPTYKRASFLEGNVLDSETGRILTNATISIIGEPNSNTNSDDEGTFQTGFADEGTKTVILSHPGYLSEAFEVSVSSGAVTTQDFTLSLIPSVSEITPITNPVENVLTITAPEGNVVEWELLDTSGRRIKEGINSQNQTHITILFFYPAGTYLFHYQTTEGESGVIKLLKRTS